ncbi:MAG: hypothetical protein LBH54_05965 [Clostridiales bacterium]|nr:hypothetical protein [Clostridiales bacterium]
MINQGVFPKKVRRGAVCCGVLPGAADGIQGSAVRLTRGSGGGCEVCGSLRNVSNFTKTQRAR